MSETPEHQTDIDKTIDQLKNSPFGTNPLGEPQIRDLIFGSKDVLLTQPMLLELTPPARIVGSILGQFQDLLRILDLQTDSSGCKLIFLGDYIDRDSASIETICLLLSCKIRHPEKFFLLRGCQETSQISRACGFFDECSRRYSESLWERFVDCFNCMPVAAIVEGIFLSHGGFSPGLTSLAQIRDLKRPANVLDHGLLCNLLWSEPSRDVQGWEEKEHGVSYCFGIDVVDQFLKDFDLKCAVRSHQVAPYGYEFFGDRKQISVVFSAPNFRNSGNFGAVMDVKEDLSCCFKLLTPDECLSTQPFRVKSKSAVKSKP